MIKSQTMKGGGKVNVGTIQAVLGSTQQLMPQEGNVTSSARFGASFKEMLANGSSTETIAEVAPSHTISAEQTIMALLSAETVEEIAEIIDGEQVNIEPSELLDIDKFLEKVSSFLEQSGFDGHDWEPIYDNPLWSLLEFFDEVAPQFFAGLTDALEGKGRIPQEEALTLLATLKAVMITAPQTDLLLKQEQQVFSLQSYLTNVSERVENTIQVSQNRNGVPKFLALHQTVKVLQQVETKQHALNEEGLRDRPQEMNQPVIHALSGLRSGQPLTEVENPNEARNETLLREMQNIFKRSNFGQVGGANRLLIKLYPEHLGQVRVELLHTNGVLTARILASTALGKEMLESQLHQLRQAFLQQNVQVERIDIAQTLQDAPRSDRDQQSFQQHTGKEQDQSKEQQEQQSDEEMTFQQYMIELEV